MIVTNFKATDLDSFDAVAPVSVSPEQALALQAQSSWTARDDDGKVVACGGAVRLWEGRYVAWAYMTKQSGRYMRQLTKATRAFMDTLNARRVEVTVVHGFDAGHRWAKMLGFELETPCMPGYGPDGADHAMYVRMKR